ncbi:RagB/SusD family nutrient uptake outer membrane protein [Deminuibacter soli]|uniref:RagB/SusD family nutrient uptake outer membrane protein n=1 Tax=Deminuibacter soli TaxID=2291815 RepID=A0A3E1NGQ1_9BACT|nr:RagB/SusD family nutrient uptake outer membrane protein [Deminuibacter soli]RFM27062.1 RagB/SusD family nutrient uptake outer membrane protein [Deminuibacter soli]
MKKYTYPILLPVLALMLGFASCTKDLNLQPLNANTADKQYATMDGYKQVLAKVYGSYSLVSSSGVGVSDINIAGITDAGTTDFVRAYWNLQELTTDEAVCAWNDANLQAFHNINWTSSNVLVNALYARSLYQITVCNELIRESADDKIAARGFKEGDAATIRNFRAEARFLRAYQYWVLMDLFGNPPFVTEKDPIGKFIPPQISRADLFKYVEAELKAIDADLVPARQNEYARADQGAAWALLARLYLNAKVYTGTEHYGDAITYAQKVIGAGYALQGSFKSLFMGDNNIANTEVILPIAYDAINSQNYGGTTFLICAAHGTNVADNKAYGIPGGGWLGNRSTKSLPQVFGDYSGATDSRAQFGPGNLEVNDVLTFNDGLAVYKFNNLTSKGATPPSANGVLCRTDFPLFRLAEMYLVYAEAVLRGGAGGSNATALQYINLLRTRAYGNSSGNLGSIALQDVLNERMRELYWEGFRRTDLIRFEQFTGNTYLWPWKGGVKNGAGVDAHFALFPIPSAETIANPNLKQNSGY